MDATASFSQCKLSPQAQDIMIISLMTPDGVKYYHLNSCGQGYCNSGPTFCKYSDQILAGKRNWWCTRPRAGQTRGFGQPEASAGGSQARKVDLQPQEDSVRGLGWVLRLQAHQLRDAAITTKDALHKKASDSTKFWSFEKFFGTIFKVLAGPVPCGPTSPTVTQKRGGVELGPSSAMLCRVLTY